MTTITANTGVGFIMENKLRGVIVRDISHASSQKGFRGMRRLGRGGTKPKADASELI